MVIFVQMLESYVPSATVDTLKSHGHVVGMRPD